MDENQKRVGHDQIREWYHETRNAYNFTAEPIKAHDEAGETVLVCTVSGTFPGSPVDLSYRFRLNHGKITTLSIL